MIWYVFMSSEWTKNMKNDLKKTHLLNLFLLNVLDCNKDIIFSLGVSRHYSHKISNQITYGEMWTTLKKKYNLN